ncbi:MAG: hypothetical protein M3P44_00890 [Actinomycetota bacterium]|nr:hypothetical protein [Actinomycetota bacterium]
MTAAVRRQRTRRERRDRALRTAVLRFGGCLAQVPAVERRVLTLRAGVGIDRVRPRSVVARMTGFSVRRVARIERRGLRELRRRARAGGCTGPSLDTADASPVMISLFTPFGPLGPSPSGAGVEPRGGVLSETVSGKAKSSRPSAEARPGSDLLAGPTALGPGGSGGGFNPAYVLIPLALLGYAAFVVRGERRT